ILLQRTAEANARVACPNGTRRNSGGSPGLESDEERDPHSARTIREPRNDASDNNAVVPRTRPAPLALSHEASAQPGEVGAPRPSRRCQAAARACSASERLLDASFARAVSPHGADG